MGKHDVCLCGVEFNPYIEQRDYLQRTDKIFIRHSGKKYCSPKCRDKYKRQSMRKRWLVIIKKLGMDSCCLCGYNKSFLAIDFHHLDPTNKDIAVSHYVNGSIPSEEKIKELRKCVALCKNCHIQVHHGDLGDRLTEKLLEDEVIFAQAFGSPEEMVFIGIDLAAEGEDRTVYLFIQRGNQIGKRNFNDYFMKKFMDAPDPREYETRILGNFEGEGVEHYGYDGFFDMEGE